MNKGVYTNIHHHTLLEDTDTFGTRNLIQLFLWFRDFCHSTFCSCSICFARLRSASCVSGGMGGAANLVPDIFWQTGPKIVEDFGVTVFHVRIFPLLLDRHSQYLSVLTHNAQL
jgi:hypothetical protein